MEEKRAVVIFRIDTRGEEYDLEVPLRITANELFHALNEAYHLGVDEQRLADCYLQAVNPIALLKGDRTLEEFGVRNATRICFMERN